METDDPWARALALLAPDAVEEFRRHRALRPAIGRVGLSAWTFVTSQDEFGLWISQHNRRIAIGMTLAVLDARDMGVTAGELLRTCEQILGANRPVVAAVVERAAASGDLSIESAGVAWGNRKLVIQPKFHQRLRDGLCAILGDLGDLIPELAGVSEALEDPATLRSFLLTFGMISSFRPDLVADGPIDQFTRRDRGLGFLHYFLRHQAYDPNRTQLLERVTLSRRRLARDMMVSRMHVARLLEDGQASGAFTMPSPDEIVFSRELSERYEARMAVGLQIVRATCVAARLDAPVDHGRMARVDRTVGPPAG